MEPGAARGRSVWRVNIAIAMTAAIIGLIYGHDLGSIAGALTLLGGIGTMGAANAILAYALDSPATFALLGIPLFTVGFDFGYGSLVWVYASRRSAPAGPRRAGLEAPVNPWSTAPPRSLHFSRPCCASIKCSHHV